jgi:ABC-type Fe3+ transport system permease subunit
MKRSPTSAACSWRFRFPSRIKGVHATSILTGLVAFVGIVLMWLPAGAFVWKVLTGIGPSALGKLIQEQWSPRLLELWRTNLNFALTIAVLSTLTGFLLHRLLLRRPLREHPIWLMVYALTLVGSPYILIQGWLNFSGPNTWLQSKILPAGWTLYSPAGYILVQVLLNSGLAFLVIHGSKALLDRKYADFTAIYRPSFRNRLRTLLRIQYLPSLLVSFSFLFLLAYWHYDSASILRQNLLSLELMTAFGSFYDDGQAAAIAVPACLAVLPVAWVMSVFLSPLALSMKAPAPIQPLRSCFWVLAGLALLPVLTLGASLGGLLSRFSSPRVAWESLKLARADFVNTTEIGLLSGLLLAVCALPIAWYLRVHPRKARWIMPLLVLALSIPAVISGIGFIHLRNLTGEAHWPEGPVRLVILNVLLWLPVCILLALASLTRLPIRWIEEMRLLRLSCSVSLFRMVGPFVIPVALQLFMVGFALSIREVPASLLNYTPEGGTLALTIETMLHFEQPDALSALCLAQFGLVATLWGMSALGLHFIRKRLRWPN